METKFPVARIHSESAHTSETFGAFSEMNLSRNSPSKQQMNIESRQHYSPAFRSDNYGVQPGTANETMDSVIRINRDGPLLDRGTTTSVYRPTTTRSEASAASTKKSYSKLAEVYSNSGDTVEFVHNFGDYCSTLVSPYIWILLLSMIGIWAVILILIGSFNIHFCHVQPMIPIYLIVAGSLLIVFVSVSIYNVWPMPDNVRPVSLSATLACRAIQALILLGITVWLILGCIWTYGARQYVHFQDAMFEMHYCDSTTYWVAFINATLHLAFIAIGVLLIAIILALGVWKETDMADASV